MMTKTHTPPSRAALISVYATALLLGLSVVSFPASANQLRAAHGFSDAQYGAIFLPQLVGSVIGAALGGKLASRLGLTVLLRCALAALFLAESALLLTSYTAQAAYAVLLSGTLLAGLGFGLAAAPLNAWPGLLFPRRAETALVALHTAMGAGFALGPLAVGALTGRGLWQLAPVLVAGGCLLIAGLSAAVANPRPDVVSSVASGDARAGGNTLVAIAVLYAFAEGTFSNWVSVYLREERGVSVEAAALALSMFWAGLVLGRLGVSALLLRVDARRIWLSLPPLIALAFFAVSAAQGAASGIPLFAFAGLACGGFFPLTVSQALTRDPARGTAIASTLTAALMLGAGLGSFLIGPLRSVSSLERIYAGSAVYPLLAFALALTLGRRGVKRGAQPSDRLPEAHSP